MQYIDLEIQPSPCTHGLRAGTLLDDDSDGEGLVSSSHHCAVAFMII